jgi:hypothetical protein
VDRFKIVLRWALTPLLAVGLLLPAASMTNAYSVWDGRTQELCSPKTGVESYTYGGSVYTANHRLYYTVNRIPSQARKAEFYTPQPAVRSSTWSDYRTYGSSAYGYYGAYDVERFCSY